MTTQLDPQADTLLFSTLANVEFTDSGRGRGAAWSSEARLSILAIEIARYMPDLAADLVRGGLTKLAA